MQKNGSSSSSTLSVSDMSDVTDGRKAGGVSLRLDSRESLSYSREPGSPHGAFLEDDDTDGIPKERHMLLSSNDSGSSTQAPSRDEGQEPAVKPKDKPIPWRALPRKDQLFVLSLARLSEPLTQTSLGSYLFYQLKSFDPSVPDSTTSYQAGIIQASFPAAQFLTAMLWGRYADSEYGGRKRVLLLGLLGTMFSILGFGFSHSFATAVFFRSLGGILNGNIGVMRTMISEIIKEKKYQTRAFVILPLTFNVGVIIGPILGKLSPSFG